MKEKLPANQGWDDLMEYERTHEIAFAAPGALREARLVAELERVKQNRRPRYARHRKAVAA
ncbi:MAG: hypothetical protein HY735_31090 [Verrucomicrobia bacterium]|nr:hypothetical protein [Verrucomicrobiota bacterium]